MKINDKIDGQTLKVGLLMHSTAAADTNWRCSKCVTDVGPMHESSTVKQLIDKYAIQPPLPTNPSSFRASI